MRHITPQLKHLKLLLPLLAGCASARPPSLAKQLQEPHKNHLQIAQTLADAGFPNTASARAFRAFKEAPPEDKHRAAHLLVELGLQAQDDILVPNLLHDWNDKELHRLPPALRNWTYFQLQRVQLRAGQYQTEPPKDLDPEAPFYGHTIYALGIAQLRAAHRSRSKIPPLVLQRLEEARDWFSKRQEYAREASIAQLAMARLLYTTRQFTRSADAFKKALKSPDLSAQARLEIFWPLFMAGQFQEAQEHLDAVSRDPSYKDHPEHIVQQATLHFQRCRYAKAQEVSEQLLSSKSPTAPKLFPRLNRYRARLAQIKEEHARLVEQLSSAPTLRAELSADLKVIQERQRGITEALAKSRQNRDRIFLEGLQLQAQLLRLESLLEQAQASPAQFPDCSSPPKPASLHVRQEKLTQAITQLDQIIARKPRRAMPRLLFRAATMRMELGRLYRTGPKVQVLVNESVGLLRRLVQEYPEYRRLDEAKMELKGLLADQRGHQVL